MMERWVDVEVAQARDQDRTRVNTSVTHAQKRAASRGMELESLLSPCFSASMLGSYSDANDNLLALSDDGEDEDDSLNNLISSNTIRCRSNGVCGDCNDEDCADNDDAANQLKIRPKTISTSRSRRRPRPVPQPQQSSSLFDDEYDNDLPNLPDCRVPLEGLPSEADHKRVLGRVLGCLAVLLASRLHDLEPGTASTIGTNNNDNYNELREEWEQEHVYPASPSSCGKKHEAQKQGNPNNNCLNCEDNTNHQLLQNNIYSSTQFLHHATHLMFLNSSNARDMEPILYIRPPPPPPSTIGATNGNGNSSAASPSKIGCNIFGFTTPWTASKLKGKDAAPQAACLSEEPPQPQNLFASSSPLSNGEYDYEENNNDTKATPPPSFCCIDSLDEIAYLDGIDDVDTAIKGVTNPGGIVTASTGSAAVTSCNNGIPVSIRAVANLKLCVYYLKHMERVQRKPVVNTINLMFVHSYRDQQWNEASFKKTTEEPVINDKDWPRTLETIKESLAFQYGAAGATLDYVVRPDIAVKPESEHHVEGYDTVDQ
jgi:hypothetical protein